MRPSLAFCSMMLWAAPGLAQTQPPASAANPFGGLSSANYNVIPLDAPAPAIDGRLDDECWRRGVVESSFNRCPRKARRQPVTKMKILYDRKHVYVAIRAYDDLARMHRFLAARLHGRDVVGVCFDSYFDKRTASSSTSPRRKQDRSDPHE